MIKRWKTEPFKTALNIKVSIWSWSLLSPYSWLSIWCEVFDSGLFLFISIISLYSDGHFTFLTITFQFCPHLIQFWSLLSSKFIENAELLLAHWTSTWLFPIYLIQTHLNLLSRSSKMKTWSQHILITITLYRTESVKMYWEGLGQSFTGNTVFFLNDYASVLSGPYTSGLACMFLQKPYFSVLGKRISSPPIFFFQRHLYHCWTKFCLKHFYVFSHAVFVRVCSSTQHKSPF